jgi:hypothetical protein
MRRWRWLAGAAVGIAAIVAARACWPELPDPLPRGARSHAGRLLDGAAVDDESADESDAAELEADRSPEAAAPVPAGATRYRMKFVKADGQSLTTARVVVRPEGATEPRTITPVRGGAAVLDLDDACRAVDFSAHGYVDVHRAIDARDRRKGDLGAIAFIPAATLDVRIVGAPRRATPWLAISTWAKTEVRYDQVGFGIAKAGSAIATTSRGHAHAVESHRHHYGAQGRGWRRRVASMVEHSMASTLQVDRLRAARGPGTTSGSNWPCLLSTHEPTEHMISGHHSRAHGH